MTHNKKYFILITGVALIITSALFVVFRGKPVSVPTESPAASPSAAPTATPAPSAKYKTLRAAEMNADAAYTFSAEIPTTWNVEPAEHGAAIAIYDPTASGATNLEKTQIYIKKFSASTFLTLSTVTIHSQISATVNSRPAVRYDIEKKASVAAFTNQPAWRSIRHIVTDVRVTDASPTTFYVIAKNPSLSDDIYNHFLDTFQVIAPKVIQEPVADFKARITKKSFGTYITPATSPVQPEKFTGYHTGVDVEYADVTADTAVVAIADGTVLASRSASGYGGVVAIQHVINGQSLIGVYGHLDPASMVATGATVAAGQQIGVLGADKSSETDGERKHLHLSILKGTTLNIKGYVATQGELSDWIDPLSLYI